MAKFWNKTPSEWDSLGLDDKSRMIAFYDAEMTVSAWENHLQAEEYRKQELKNK